LTGAATALGQTEEIQRQIKQVLVELERKQAAVRVMQRQARTPQGGIVLAPDARGVQDLVFFADNRPVLIRLQVLIDGRPINGALDAFVEKMFKYFDRNGDGVLSKQEVERAPKAATLQAYMRQGYFYYTNPNGQVTLAEIDKDNKDGKVTLETFK